MSFPVIRFSLKGFEDRQKYENATHNLYYLVYLEFCCSARFVLALISSSLSIYIYSYSYLIVFVIHCKLPLPVN